MRLNSAFLITQVGNATRALSPAPRLPQRHAAVDAHEPVQGSGAAQVRKEDRRQVTAQEQFEAQLEAEDADEAEEEDTWNLVGRTNTESTHPSTMD